MQAKIFKNSMLLFIRQALLVMVGIIATRLTLAELGVSDFGVFMTIYGVVLLGTFVTSSITQIAQRNFSYILGQENYKKLSDYFSATVVFVTTITGLIALLLYGLGDWIIINFLEFELARENELRSVFINCLLVFSLGIMRAPFQAIMISYETFKSYANLSIVDAITKIIVVYGLIYTNTNAKLLTYSYYLLFSAIFIQTLYILYCFRRFEIIQLVWPKNYSKIVRDFTPFLGWTIFGQITSVLRMHGLTILFSGYLGPEAAAARGLALQFTGQLRNAVQNFNISLYSPLVAAYAQGNMELFRNSLLFGVKLTFYASWILFFPIYVHAEFILDVWLVDVPKYSSDFLKFMLIETGIMCIAMPIMTAARASANMRKYEITLGTFQLIIVLVVWFLLHAEFGYKLALHFVNVISFIMFIVRYQLMTRLVNLTNVEIQMANVFKHLMVLSLTVAFHFCLNLLNRNVIKMSDEVNYGILLFSVCIVVFSLSLTNNERAKVIRAIKKKISRK